MRSLEHHPHPFPRRPLVPLSRAAVLLALLAQPPAALAQPDAPARSASPGPQRTDAREAADGWRPAAKLGAWRRTTRGWERVDRGSDWAPLARPPVPAATGLHPLVWALLQLLLAVAGLMAAEPRPKQR